MSQAAVLTAIATLGAGITGLDANHVMQGMPIPLPSVLEQYPLLVIECDPPQFTQKTMSDAGQLEAKWLAYLTLFLGPADTAPQDALAAMVLYPERFRAKFAPHSALSSVCFEHEFGNPIANVRTFRRLNEEPKVEWKLLISEWVTVSAAP